MHTTPPPSGWLFVAVDGFTGPAWDGLAAEAVREAYALSQAHLSAASPVSEAHVICGAVPVVPVVCRTATGESFTVPTSPSGHIEAYASEGTGAEPKVVRAVVDGEVTVALYRSLVDLLGAPSGEDSNAAA